MKATRITSLIFATVLLGATQAQAATVGIGTTKGGATAQVSAGISKIVSSHAGMQMRPRPMGGTAQYVPVVNAGELEFGISNAMQTYMDFTGTGMSQGKKSSNLRLVASLMTFKSALFAKTSSGIRTIADLKGKRVPGEFSGAPLFKYLFEANLANANLGWNDVTMVPQAGLRQHWAAFTKGKLDVGLAAIGSGIVKKLNAAAGGIVFLDLSTDAAAVKRMNKFAPKASIRTVKPAKPFVGVLAPTDVIHFKYLLWANKNVSGKVIHDVVKALYDHEKELLTLSPLWKTHKSAAMATRFGKEMPYHPAAIKFYKKVGIWKGK